MNNHIIQNYTDVINKIKSVCVSSGRNFNDITLVAVSKTFPSAFVNELFNFGHLDFGENKVQELVTKHNELKNLNINWHLIGHLQSNKVKYIIDFVHLIHSVDSVKLATEIQNRASAANKSVNILIQVNISGESSKSGVNPSETKNLLKQISFFENIKILGLMTIGSLTENRNIITQNFRDMKNLYDELLIDYSDFKYLSMGMSSDFDIAIQNGANLLRIGSSIFGNRNYKF